MNENMFEIKEFVQNSLRVIKCNRHLHKPKEYSLNVGSVKWDRSILILKKAKQYY